MSNNVLASTDKHKLQTELADLEDASNELMLLDDDQVRRLDLMTRCQHLHGLSDSAVAWHAGTVCNW